MSDLKLNLGCSDDLIADGYTNVDIHAPKGLSVLERESGLSEHEADCVATFGLGWLWGRVFAVRSRGGEATRFQHADLSKPWPWPDSSVKHIRAHDIIEHLVDKIHTMNEAWRVLEPGGTFDIVVPTTDGPGAWQDPTHVSFWNRNSFMYFEHNNPHLVRFGEAYGVKCAFRVVREKLERLVQFGDVVKLSILLEAVK